MPLWLRRPALWACSTKMSPSQSYTRGVACEHSPDDQTLQAGAREDDFVTDQCPCGTGTGSQTTEHQLPSCPIYEPLREGIWPDQTPIARKLYGSLGTCDSLPPSLRKQEIASDEREEEEIHLPNSTDRVQPANAKKNWWNCSRRPTFTAKSANSSGPSRNERERLHDLYAK